MGKKEQIRALTDGAIITALYAVLLLASRFIGGLLENWLHYILPLPIAIYGYKYSWKESCIVACSIFAISFLCVIQPFSVLFIVLPSLICGLFLPLLVKKGAPIWLEILCTTILAFVGLLLSNVFFGWMYEYDIIQDTIAFADEIFTSMQLTSFSLEFFHALVVSLIPSIMIISSLIEGLFVDLLLHLLLVRFHMRQKEKKNYFSGINFIPSWVGILYIVFFTSMLYALTQLSKVEGTIFIIYSVIINITIVFSFFIIYQGFYFLATWSNYHQKKWVYYLGVLSIFFFPFLILFLGLAQNIFHLTLKIR